MTTLVARALDLPGGRGVHLFERNVMSHRARGRSSSRVLRAALLPALPGLRARRLRRPGRDRRAADRLRAFVAPALLAASAFNGAFYDATNIFWKLRYQKVYDAVLATPLGPKDIASGETAFALFRGLIYAVGFFGLMLALGLIHSWWAVFALPATVFIGFAFAGAGIAAVTYMRSWQDFDILNLAILPMFLFSATFLPTLDVSGLARGGDPGDAALSRRRPPACLTTGTVGPGSARRRRLPDRARLVGTGSPAGGREAPAHVSTSSAVEAARFSLLRILGYAASRPADRSPNRRCLELRHGIREAERGGTLSTNPGCPQCGYVGWCRRRASGHRRGVTAPPRIAAAPARAIRLTPPK
jgi:lipooligosaccharide transport system permease protein